MALRLTVAASDGSVLPSIVSPLCSPEVFSDDGKPD